VALALVDVAWQQLVRPELYRLLSRWLLVATVTIRLETAILLGT
jgi:hypothetical protein